MTADGPKFQSTQSGLSHCDMDLSFAVVQLKSIPHRVRVAHVEHFASLGASIPQWHGLRKHDLELWGGWRLMRLGKLWEKRGKQNAVN